MAIKKEISFFEKNGILISILGTWMVMIGITISLHIHDSSQSQDIRKEMDKKISDYKKESDEKFYALLNKKK